MTCSWIFERSPTMIGFISPRSTAPKKIELPLPTVTSPITYALGAMKTSSATLGVFPSKVMIGTTLARNNLSRPQIRSRAVQPSAPHVLISRREVYRFSEVPDEPSQCTVLSMVARHFQEFL